MAASWSQRLPSFHAMPPRAEFLWMPSMLLNASCDFLRSAKNALKRAQRCALRLQSILPATCTVCAHRLGAEIHSQCSACPAAAYRDAQRNPELYQRL